MTALQIYDIVLALLIAALSVTCMVQLFCYIKWAIDDWFDRAIDRECSRTKLRLQEIRNRNKEPHS